jgi:uncharacterized protein (DUF2344 family)
VYKITDGAASTCRKRADVYEKEAQNLGKTTVTGGKLVDAAKRERRKASRIISNTRKAVNKQIKVVATKLLDKKTTMSTKDIKTAMFEVKLAPDATEGVIRWIDNSASDIISKLSYVLQQGKDKRAENLAAIIKHSEQFDLRPGGPRVRQELVTTLLALSGSATAAAKQLLRRELTESETNKVLGTRSNHDKKV